MYNIKKGTSTADLLPQRTAHKPPSLGWFKPISECLPESRQTLTTWYESWDVADDGSRTASWSLHNGRGNGNLSQVRPPLPPGFRFQCHSLGGAARLRPGSPLPRASRRVSPGFLAAVRGLRYAGACCHGCVDEYACALQWWLSDWETCGRFRGSPSGQGMVPRLSV